MKFLKPLALVLSSAIIFTGCNSKKIGKTEINNGIDSISYSIGVSIANNLKSSKLEDANVKALAYAIETALDKDSTNDKMTLQEASEYINKFFMAKQKADKEKELKAFEGNIEKGKKFLEENAKAEGVIVDPSGIQYKVVKEGNGPMPSETDVVKVHYVGKLLDGTEFDSSYKRNEPIEFPLNQVIRGWSIGVQKMRVGSKHLLFIPHELAYGDNKVGEKIEPFSTLIFEVELVEIVKRDSKK